MLLKIHILICAVFLLVLQGRFEILTLTGSFMLSESGEIRNKSGGMSVSLASPDGRVVGGGVASLLVAASPIQCKFCAREGNINMIAGRGQPLTLEVSEAGKSAPLMQFDCRGLNQ